MKTTAPRPQLGVLFLTIFIDLVGFSIIFPLFPDMLAYYLEREGSSGLLGRLVEILSALSGAEGEKATLYTTVLFGGVLGSLYSFLQFLFAPVWGRLSDRIGRRPVLLLTISGLAASYLLWAFSGSFLLLILSRLLGGIMGGNISVATAAVADSTGEASRAKGMGLIGAAFGLGFIFGPALGGSLSGIHLEATGLPGLNPFSAAAAGAFLLSVWNLVWVARRFRESFPAEARSPRGTVLRTAHPLKLFRGFDLPGVTRTNLVYFIFQVAFAGMEFTLTFLAKDRFGYSPRDMMWIFIYSGLLIAIVQGGLVRRLAPRLGEKRVALSGLVLLLPGLVLTGQSATEAVFYLGVGLLAAGSALVAPCLTALVSLYSPSDRQGEVLGTFRSLGALSRAVAPVLACAVYWKMGAEWPYYGSALLLVVPFALALGLPPARGARIDRAEDATQGTSAGGARAAEVS